MLVIEAFNQGLLAIVGRSIITRAQGGVLAEASRLTETGSGLEPVNGSGPAPFRRAAARPIIDALAQRSVEGRIGETPSKEEGVFGA
jgi:hypothetical protein